MIYIHTLDKGSVQEKGRMTCTIYICTYLGQRKSAGGGKDDPYNIHTFVKGRAQEGGNDDLYNIHT